MSLQNQRIVVGVTGGIAAYKTPELVRRLRDPELVRRLRDQQAEVRVVMTAGAGEFISALTLQAVSGNPVHDSLLDHRAEAGMGHIELARWADTVIIAPATANSIARLANGLADDLLSTLCLATEAPIVVAPAMNRVMWSNRVTQRNVDTLRADGKHIVGPDSGDQACGETGAGRMTDPEQIIDAVLAVKGANFADPLRGRHVMVTAGPTWEALDPVRGITNHSSGKMGFAIARAAAEAGARVTLIAGPCTLHAADGVERVDIVSAEDMYEAVHAKIDSVDVFIGVAAVADYRPRNVADQKIKKNEDQMVLDLVRNRDIVASVATLADGPYTVGFAAETNDVIANARKKLMAKNLDLVCANTVGGEEGGFGSDKNALTLIDRTGVEELPMGDKLRLARQLVHSVTERLDGQYSTQNPGQSSG